MVGHGTYRLGTGDFDTHDDGEFDCFGFAVSPDGVQYSSEYGQSGNVPCLHRDRVAAVRFGLIKAIVTHRGNGVSDAQLGVGIRCAGLCHR